MLWEPPAGVQRRFSVLHLPAAVDEMNKSRRIVASQARALAMLGGTVASLDPRGTGDSEGDHGDATWRGWGEDAEVAWHWLLERAGGPGILWGTRLGALAAVDLVASGRLAAELLLLWQPVTSGRAWLGQFLRLAGAQFTGESEARGGDLRSLRASLAAGRAIEVAGYEINLELANGIEETDLLSVGVPDCPTIWREVTNAAALEPTPAARRVVERWDRQGGQTDIQVVTGGSYWMTRELEDVPALIESTSKAVERWLISRRSGDG